jgi:micrococcal nuclease
MRAPLLGAALGALLALGVACTPPPPHYADDPGALSASLPREIPSTGTVSRVVDGDTLHVDVGPRSITVRVLGIDTPETVKPGTPVQCGGPQASAFAHQWLDHQTVRLVSDPTQSDVDIYGRELRYVRKLDGTDYSVAVTVAGWAKPYVFHHKPAQDFDAVNQAMQQAIAEHRGIWGVCPS